MVAIIGNKSLIKYRIVESRIIQSSKTDYIYHYSPQVRINGVWFNILKWTEKGGTNHIYFHIYSKQECLSSDDAMKLIEQFKSAGSIVIPSNRKLNSNEKAIKVE
jgi:hypothetical protein